MKLICCNIVFSKGAGRMCMDDILSSENDKRISLNIRVDGQKSAVLERLRKTGFGYAETERNRSDVYNEILGYGIQLHMIKQELGDRDFEKMWKLMHKLNLSRLNFSEIEKMVEAK